MPVPKDATEAVEYIMGTAFDRLIVRLEYKRTEYHTWLYPLIRVHTNTDEQAQAIAAVVIDELLGVPHA